jgi:acyl-CoA hydrolase
VPCNLPREVGQVVHLSARVTAAFRTSIEIMALASGEDPWTGERWPTNPNMSRSAHFC